MNVISYYIMCIKWFFEDLFGLIKNWFFLQQYKRHLAKRIEKNNFGRREEW